MAVEKTFEGITVTAATDESANDLMLDALIARLTSDDGLLPNQADINAEYQRFLRHDTAVTMLAEAKQFIADNPAALNLIELPPNDLEAAIENRTANQETLLLKTLSFAVRLLYAENQED